MRVNICFAIVIGLKMQIRANIYLHFVQPAHPVQGEDTPHLTPSCFFVPVISWNPLVHFISQHQFNVLHIHVNTQRWQSALLPPAQRLCYNCAQKNCITLDNDK